jgi:parvulin-like peptidyl-prolyl isomerase
MGVIAIAALVGGAVYQYWLLPRQDLATVNGDTVERRDYWKVRGLQLRQNVAQLQQQISFTPADQQPQIQQQITDALEELDNVEDAPIASDTLASMVDDLLILQHADDLGVTISDAEIDEFVDAQFAPVPLESPTPTATIEPTAAAWATGTVEAENALATEQASETAAAQTATAESGTPEASPATDDDAEATASATEEAAEVTETGTPVVTDGEASPPADGTASPEASPEGSPEASETPTPNAEEALATSETTFSLYEENFLEPSDLGRSDYERLIVRPQLAREKIAAQLEAEVPARAEQVHAAHLLVATEDAAREALDRINGGEDFGDVAREVSTDTATAGTGGDLGWFPRGVMVEPFTEAAFALQPDEISEPVQSEFGWHVIKVLEREDDRPLTLSTLQSLKSRAFNVWLQERRDEADLETDIELPEFTTEEDVVDSTFFEAPPDAPVPPTPTLAPTPTELPASPETESDTETDSDDGEDATPTP